MSKYCPTKSFKASGTPPKVLIPNKRCEEDISHIVSCESVKISQRDVDQYKAVNEVLTRHFKRGGEKNRNLLKEDRIMLSKEESDKTSKEHVKILISKTHNGGRHEPQNGGPMPNAGKGGANKFATLRK